MLIGLVVVTCNMPLDCDKGIMRVPTVIIRGTDWVMLALTLLRDRLIVCRLRVRVRVVVSETLAMCLLLSRT